ncbi:hypothetical protein JMA_27340 [Jeotgalibacillus malaysiensis]|uniref:dUTPase n=1 Tax=Jeotgalibacillus malaysiensis TaxID=1508404 RepID=A0A0B5APM2_9BACL|nr:dUTP diphosphatase [Jeotgalibacillus malaysiensis]AJD92051.1 hypothetical protein JMA_27340 [Jeotgalibacillus malaysiensis]
MELTKLFNAQRQLDEHIEKEHPRQPGEDRLAKKILALHVELGELANEWRGFKFWSRDQKPRTIEHKFERFVDNLGNIEILKNPLLEEYVDNIHFAVSIALDLNVKPEKIAEFIITNVSPKKSIEDKFLYVNKKLVDLYEEIRDRNSANAVYYWVRLFEQLLQLGTILGFSWDEIEAAYFEKNKINHIRQENFY